MSEKEYDNADMIIYAMLWRFNNTFFEYLLID